MFDIVDVPRTLLGGEDWLLLSAVGQHVAYVADDVDVGVLHEVAAAIKHAARVAA